MQKTIGVRDKLNTFPRGKAASPYRARPAPALYMACALCLCGCLWSTTLGFATENESTPPRTAAVQGMTQEEAADGFQPMFNGRNLEGWEGKPDWHVEDGAITCESTEEKPCVKHHYLYWRGAQPGDFILRARFKIVGGNSGIQFRSEERPDYDIWGYQADIEDGTEWMGCLFQHDRGAVVLRGFAARIAPDGAREEQRLADPHALLGVVRHHDWNEYEIIAVGPTVELKINGTTMCRVEDRDAKFSRRSGHIALQMHPGPPMKVQFKDLRIKILDKTP